MGKVLLTGGSGFLGSYILDFLKNEKYEVVKVGRSEKSDVKIDLSVTKLKKMEVDYVIHVAGKAHVIPKTDEEKEEFFKVNYIGTKNLLEGLDATKVQSIIFISTVAVYGKETGELIDENSPLNGDTPYAQSKKLAEGKILSFCNSNNVNVIILRLPLITGKSPKGNLCSIMQAIKKGYYFRIGNGDARRSMVAALDIAKLIPDLFNKNGIYNLTDRRHPSFKEIDSHIASYYGKSIKKMPVWLLAALAKVGDVIRFFPLNSIKFDKMTKSLTFSDDKAVRELNWNPDNALKYIKE